MPDVNTVAEASTATPATPAAPERIQYDAWDEKGNPVVSRKQDPPKPQASAPAASEEEDHSDNAAESEAAKPSQEKHSRPKGKLSADERIAQLEATIQKIRESQGQTKAEPSPAAKKEESPKEAPKALEPPKKPVRPKESDFDGTPGKTWEDYQKAMDAYEDARDKYVEDLADFKSKQAVEQDRQQRREAEQKQQIDKEFAEAKKVYPDFDAKATPILETLTTDKTINPAFANAVGLSPVFPHLIYALSKEQAATLLDTARKDPITAIKQLGVLENAVMEELQKSKSEAKGGKKAEETEGGEAKGEEETPVSPKPRAPKPPSEVGGKGTALEDASVAAARSGNFSAFEQAENAKLKARFGK